MSCDGRKTSPGRSGYCVLSFNCYFDPEYSALAQLLLDSNFRRKKNISSMWFPRTSSMRLIASCHIFSRLVSFANGRQLKASTWIFLDYLNPIIYLGGRLTLINIWLFIALASRTCSFRVQLRHCWLYFKMRSRWRGHQHVFPDEPKNIDSSSSSSSDDSDATPNL